MSPENLDGAGLGAVADGQIQDPKAAILIGLGGTGGEILLRIRKKFYDASSTFSLEEWPIVKYLYIDTDMADKDLQDRNQMYYKFDASDFLPISMDDWGTYTRDLHNHTSLKKWWYEDQQPLNQVAMNAGAGQIRGYSRLGFWNHAAEIRDRITRLISAAVDPSAISTMAQRGIGVQANQIYVYVIGSLAGGTGGGAFLDMGYLLRDMNIGGLQSMAFLVLPRVFEYLQMPQDRMKANAYASLMELEFFNTLTRRKAEFDDRWQDERPQNPTKKTPYDRVFLIDGKNLVGQQCGVNKSRDGLLDLVADHIFLDYSASTFGNAKRSAYPNQDQHLTKAYPVEHMDPEGRHGVLLREVFAKSYQTFGLSRIYVPMDRIKKSASFYVWSSAFSQLVGKISTVNTRQISEELLRDDRIPLYIGKRRIEGRTRDADDFSRALLAAEEQGRTFDDLIRMSVQNIRRQALGHDDKQTPRHEYLEREIGILDGQLFRRPSRDPARYRDWGTVYRQMELNRIQYLDGLKTTIETVANELADDSSRGLGFAIEVMDEIGRYLIGEQVGLARKWRTLIEDEEQKTQAAREAFDDWLLDLNHHERWTFMHAPLLKGTTIQHDIERACEAAERLFLQVTHKRFLEVSIDVAEEIAVYVGEIIERLKKVQRVLSEMSERMRIRAEEFAKEEQSPLNTCPYEAGDVKGMYMPKALLKTWQATNLDLAAKCLEIARTRMAGLRYRAAGDDWAALTIHGLPGALERVGTEHIETLLARSTHGDFAALDEVNVVTIFTMKYPDPQVRVKKIGAVLQMAMPWYARNPSFQDIRYENLESHYSYLVETGTEFRDFGHDVSVSFPAEMGRAVLQPSNNRHSVVFFTQLAGIPICYGDAIPNLSHAYNTSIKKGTDRLHISRDELKFPAVERMQPQELTNLRTATETFLAGVATGVISVNTDRRGSEERFVYEFSEKIDGVPQRRQLGNQKASIQRIRDEATVKAGIDSQIQRQISAFRESGKVQNLMGTIRSYYYPEIGKYCTVQITTGDDQQRQTQDIIPVEFTVLRDFYSREFGMCNDIDVEPLVTDPEKLEEISTKLPDGHRVAKKA